MWRALALGLMLALGGCAGRPARPDELDVKEHRAEAVRDQKLAAEYEARADAHEAAARPGASASGTHSRSPASSERSLAASYRAHARAHEKAARELERFEAEACSGVPPAERAACPLLGPVESVLDIPLGVRLRLVRPEDRPAVIARMRCQAAFAQAHRAEVAGCPLYVRGLDVEPGPAPGTIDLLVADDAAVLELRNRAHAEFPGPQAQVGF